MKIRYRRAVQNVSSLTKNASSPSNMMGGVVDCWTTPRLSPESLVSKGNMKNERDMIISRQFELGG